MCGRYGRRGDKQKLAEAFHVKTETADFAEDEDARPGSIQPVVMMNEDGERGFANMRWGAINRRHGTTLAFSKLDAGKLLNARAEDTVGGLRDRAILSVGLQAGMRRAEIAALAVEDLHQNRGFDSLWVVRKGGRRDSLALHPSIVQRIRAYLGTAGRSEDLDGPMFRPLKTNRKGQEERRHMDPEAIDRILRKHAKTIGIGRGYSAHSMRATFVTSALENGCPLEDVQQAAGHSEPSTTRLYDRRGHSPEKSASFFATY